MSRNVRFWTAIAPSFLAVAALAIDSEWSLLSGFEVRLEVVPYDPMDALSGRYLAVPLAIERLDAALVAPGREYRSGETVWVRLERGDPWWQPGAITDSPPGEGAVALRGIVQAHRPGSIWIDYGLGRFYIPHEGADPTLERGRHELVAVVKIAAQGRGLLADLLVDGEPWARWSARQPR